MIGCSVRRQPWSRLLGLRCADSKNLATRLGHRVPEPGPSFTLISILSPEERKLDLWPDLYSDRDSR